MGGAVIQWLRDGLGLIDKTADIEALADSVPDNGGVYFVPAFTGMGCPYWDPSARGSIQGLTRGVTGAHIARAALEAIAFQTADLLEATQRDLSQLTEPLTELRVDGGAAANNLLLQFQADLLDVPVLRPKVLETTALGAAHLAGIAVGFWESEAEVARHWQIDRRFEPRMSRDQVAQLRGQWSRAVDRARGWAG
jgi:glycerol kinase